MAEQKSHRQQMGSREEGFLYNGQIPHLQKMTREEILELIDERAQFLLGISGEEFLRRYRAGEIEHEPAEAPIIVLAALVDSD